MDDFRVRVTDEATIAARALCYDAECSREVAASIRARSARTRAAARDLREEHAAVRAQSQLAVRRTRQLAARSAAQIRG